MFWYLVCSTYGLVALYYVYKAIRALRSGRGFNRSLLDGHRHELLLAAIPFAWALGLTYLWDSFGSWPSSTDTLAQGRVIVRQMAPNRWGIRRPELLIRIENTQVLVRASLALSGTDEVPDRVSFFYSGDPNREVLIREQVSPFWGALFFLGLPVGALLLLGYVERKWFTGRGIEEAAEQAKKMAAG